MKRWKIILFFIILIMIFPNFCLAEEEHNLIYFIHDLNINDGQLSISGYSFISHRDNVGGNNSKQLKTYIVAYTGNWKSDYAITTKCNNSTNKKNCYIKQVTRSGWSSSSSGVIDFYNSRCIEPGCTSTSRNTFTIRNNFNNYINDDSCTKNNGSRCLYYNVGFNVKISLETLNSHGLTENIKFRIVSVIGGTVKSLPLGVYDKLCTVGNGSSRKSCPSAGTTITSGGYELTFGQMSTVAHYDAVNSSGYNCQISASGNCTTCDPSAPITGGVDYSILRFSKNQCLLHKGVTGGYNDYVFQIQVGSNTYWAAANRLVFSGELTIDRIAPPSPPPPEPVDVSCDTLFPSGAGGYTTKNTVNCGNSGSYDQCKIQTITSDTLLLYPSENCSSPKRGQLGQKRMLSQKGEFQTVPTDAQGGVPSGAECFVPIVVKANVAFYQTASFSFGALSPKTVYAGKGFSLSNTSYTNSITWAVVGSFKYYTYQNITNTLEKAQDWVWNSALNKAELKPLKKKSDNTLYDVYYYAIDDVDAAHPNGKYKTLTMDKAAEAVINATIKHKYKFTGTSGNTNYKLFAVTSPSTNVPNIVSSNVNNISYVSCDSDNIDNCSVSSPSQSVVGKWALTNHTEKSITVPLKNSSGTVIANYPGGKITNQYTYSLANSYVSVSGSERATAKYENVASVDASGYVATGKKYYISFEWTAGSFPFNLSKNINPSFLSNMKWSLNGTCSVKVKDGLFKEGDDGGGGGLKPTFRYRTIDVKNPFPKKVKGKIAPINWRNWYTGNVNNQNRLTNSYANYPDNPLYKITLSDSGANGSVRVSEIKGIATSYVNLDTINPRGTSSFVESYFQRGNGVRAGGKSYCPRGSYSANCDKQT